MCARARLLSLTDLSSGECARVCDLSAIYSAGETMSGWCVRAEQSQKKKKHLLAKIRLVFNQCNANSIIIIIFVSFVINNK